MSNAAIRKLIVDSVAEAIAADRTTRINDAGGGDGAAGAASGGNGVAGAAGGGAGAAGAAGVGIARGCTYKQFLGCGPIKFKGTEGAVALTRWFESAEDTFILSNCSENCKVKYAVGTLQEHAKSWWNSFA